MTLALSPWAVESEKGLRAYQVGTEDDWRISRSWEQRLLVTPRLLRLISGPTVPCHQNGFGPSVSCFSAVMGQQVRGRGGLAPVTESLSSCSPRAACALCEQLLSDSGLEGLFSPQPGVTATHLVIWIAQLGVIRTSCAERWVVDARQLKREKQGGGVTRCHMGAGRQGGGTQLRAGPHGLQQAHARQ